MTRRYEAGPIRPADGPTSGANAAANRTLTDENGHGTDMVTTQSFTCLTCDIEFESPAGLSQHVALVHRECIVCGKTFRTSEELDQHTQQAH